jgi:hypothetical protein
MTTYENSRSRPGGAESRFNGQSLVKKWCVEDPKIIFSENQEVAFLALKCKTTPVPPKSARACAKFKIYLWRLPQWNETLCAYPRWSTIYVECFSSFCFRVSIAALQKKNDFAFRKWKRHFSWNETKIGLRGIPRHPKGHTRVWYVLVSTYYAMVIAESCSFHIEVMQPRTW